MPGLITYGVVDAAAADELPDGLDEAAGDAVGVVAHGRVAALTSETEETGELQPTRRSLLAHTRVLETAAAATTTLPMRFGVVAPDESALREEFLAPREPVLVDALNRLRGHVELRLRVTYDEETAIRDVVAADPQLQRLRGARGRDAQLRLGERIAAALDRRRERDADVVLSALQPLAADAAASPTRDHLEVVDASFLVPDDAVAGFDDAVDRLGARFDGGLHVDYVGPLPPFTFAEPAVSG